jgi:prepilin-type N-terminal cleavage/methylation domain-containing protein
MMLARQKITAGSKAGRTPVACGGFTLVELMFSLIIFSYIAGGLYTVLKVGEGSYLSNSSQVELQQELRKGMEWMKYELQQAGPTSISNVPANGSWYTTITFKTPTGVSSGAISWNTDTIQFSRSGTNLRRTSGASSRTLAQDITSLQFRRLSTEPKILEVAMTGQVTPIKGEALQDTLNFKIRLRN